MKSAAAAMLLVLCAQTTQDPAPQPPGGIDAAVWQAAGPEQRWVIYRQSVTQGGALTGTWVEFLEKTRDFEMLEVLAVYEGFEMLFQKGKPGEVLYRLDAPQWMRVALWNLGQQDSHSVEAAKSPLELNAGRFRGWAERFPAVKRLGGARLLEKLAGVPPADPQGQLPPLDPRTVILPFLDAPRQLATLTPRKPFDQRERYRFQVLRAIQAISVASRFDDPYRGKLLRLTRHADVLVRRRALLEFSEFPAAKVPWSELLAMGNNAALADADREAAILAASYSDHPGVFLALHHILQQPRHPAFDAALQRAHAVGGGFTRRVLAQLPRTDLPEARRSAVAQTEKALGRARNDPTLRRLLFILAWAEHTGHPIAAELAGWARPTLREQRHGKGGQKMLAQAAADPGTTGAPKFLHERIREEAKALLESKR